MSDHMMEADSHHHHHGIHVEQHHQHLPPPDFSGVGHDEFVDMTVGSFNAAFGTNYDLSSTTTTSTSSGEKEDKLKLKDEKLGIRYNFNKKGRKQPFSKQKGGQRRGTLSEVKRHLEELAGGDAEDVKELLNELLKSRFCQTVYENTLPTNVQHRVIANSDSKLAKLVNEIKSLYDDSASNKKRQWASLVTPVLTHSEMKSLGWSITKKTFAKARKHALEVGPGRPLPPIKLSEAHPKHLTSDDSIRKMVEVLERDDVSKIIPDETVKVNDKQDGRKVTYELQKRKLLVPSFKTAYNVYKEKYGEEAVCESVFRRYIPKNIVKK